MKRSTDIPRLPTEVVLQAHKLSDPEARFLVANYYLSQELRKRADMQLRHEGDAERPVLLHYTADSFSHVEKQVQKALGKYAEGKKIGQWMLAQYGVGPVISAGLLAHLDVFHPVRGEDGQVKLDDAGEVVRTPTTTVGHWYAFAGLDPDRKWGKGQKRPWNADLKQIMFHFGECAKRASGSEKAFYGDIYKRRKAMLEERNERGHYAERAKTFVTNSPEWKAILKQGKLPPGNLDRQACNYTSKIFLSHLHALWFWDTFGAPPPKPFAIAILGHADILPIPHADMFPGFSEAYFGAARQQAAE